MQKRIKNCAENTGDAICFWIVITTWQWYTQFYTITVLEVFLIWNLSGATSIVKDQTCCLLHFLLLHRFKKTVLYSIPNKLSFTHCGMSQPTTTSESTQYLELCVSTSTFTGQSRACSASSAASAAAQLSSLVDISPFFCLQTVPLIS